MSLLVLLTASLGARSSFAKSPDGHVPVVFGISPASAVANETVELTVTLDGPTSSGQWVAVSCGSSSAFSMLPSAIYVSPGQSSGSAYAVVSSNPPADVTVTGTCNGVSEGSELAISDIGRH